MMDRWDEYIANEAGISRLRKYNANLVAEWLANECPIKVGDIIPVEGPSWKTSLKGKTGRVKAVWFTSIDSTGAWIRVKVGLHKKDGSLGRMDTTFIKKVGV